MTRTTRSVTQDNVLQSQIGFFGERLRQAREGRGYQVTELAVRIGVTRETIRRYETGESTPIPEILEKLSEELRFPIGFFTKPPADHFSNKPAFYRSLKSVGKSERASVEHHLGWLSELLTYVSQFVELPKLNLPIELVRSMPNDPKKITDDLIENAAKELREYWDLGDAPITHTIRLLETNGLVVALKGVDTPGLDGLSKWSNLGVPFVLLNKDVTSSVRLRFNICHELGHLLLHQNLPLHIAENDKMSKMLDNQAHRFAGAFLLPESAFSSDVYSITLDTFKQLKPKWHVAIAAMIERLRNLKILSESTYRDLRVKLGKREWRLVEPYDDEWPAEEPILLQQAFELIVEHFQNAERIKHDTQQDDQLVIDLANLPWDFFGRGDLDKKLIKFIVKEP